MIEEELITECILKVQEEIEMTIQEELNKMPLNDKQKLKVMLGGVIYIFTEILGVASIEVQREIMKKVSYLLESEREEK